MLQAFPNYDGNNGNTFGDKCKRDIGYIVDAVAEDLRDGGNRNIIEATKFYKPILEKYEKLLQLKEASFR